MTWTDADDNRVKEFCKTVDVGKLISCPKCGMGEHEGEMAFTPFCTHSYCPFREYRFAKLKAEHPELSETQPRVVDDDKSEITVSYKGRQLRIWSYANDDERRAKMLAAREYVEGWCDGRDAR